MKGCTSQQERKDSHGACVDSRKGSFLAASCLRRLRCWRCWSWAAIPTGDYGITVDETVERNSTLISYQYAFETLFGKDLALSDQPLETYKDRYYGVTLQMPTVVAEHLTGFTMPSRDIYMMRHLWTFLICLSGLACFYLFLERVFRNSGTRCWA